MILPRVTRRWFLKGAAATAALVAVPVLGKNYSLLEPAGPVDPLAEIRPPEPVGVVDLLQNTTLVPIPQVYDYVARRDLIFGEAALFNTEGQKIYWGDRRHDGFLRAGQHLTVRWNYDPPQTFGELVRLAKAQPRFMVRDVPERRRPRWDLSPYRVSDPEDMNVNLTLGGGKSWDPPRPIVPAVAGISRAAFDDWLAENG